MSVWNNSVLAEQVATFMTGISEPSEPYWRLHLPAALAIKDTQNEYFHIQH